MRLSSRSKKRILFIFLLPVCILLLAAGALEYLIHYRFRDSISYLVDKESKGKYAFTARQANISLWTGTITLKGSQLSCLDTAGAQLWCNMRTPEIYCTLSSWKALLLEKKLIIDSLAIVGAAMDVHIRSKPHETQNPWHITDLAEKLKTTLQHLNVHAFSLKDLSFTCEDSSAAEPLHGEHIGLSVSNFARFGNSDSHILGSDQFSFSLGREHWAIGKGRQQIDFARLTFDSRGHRFSLDSFSFRQKAPRTLDSERRELRLTADRFYFNSNRLPAVYEKDGQLQLLLDTLVCINPVLSIPEAAQKHYNDTLAKAIRETIYRWVNVRFVQVIDGRILVRSKNEHSGDASTRKANMRIYNLTVDPYSPRPITTDSIRMSINSIEFLTRDSAYKLSIGEFTIRGDDALFKQVSYGPTLPNNNKTVVFTAPYLWLRGIALPDLLRKHIKAAKAELVDPKITMTDNLQEARPAGSHSAIVDAKKLALFYRTLHNIHELIDAPDFIITGGAANYTHTGRIPIDAQIAGLNAHILLNKFFGSDSLLAIKQAIPSCHIETLNLNAGSIHLSVEHYGFAGIGQRSISRQFSLSTNDGWQLKGKNLFWNALDWDRFEKTRDIQIDSLHLDALTVHAPQPGSGHPTPAQPVAPFPFIRVHTFDLGEANVEKPIAGGNIHFFADHLRISDIRTSGHTLVWAHAATHLHDIDIKAGSTAVDIGSAAFDSDNGLAAKDIRLINTDKGHTFELTAPSAHADFNMSSSDLRQFTLTSFRTGDAEFHYSTLIKKDSLRVAGKLKATLRSIQLFPTLSAAADLSWKGVDLHHHSDSARLDLKAMAGSFHGDNVTRASLQRTEPLSWLNRITMDQAIAHYTSPNLLADAANCSWDPATRTVRLTDFHALPRMSREETFKKARWQQDYVTVKGQTLKLSGIKLADKQHVAINKAMLEGVSVEASRDKHIPFHHGVEKDMPTKLMGKIPFDVRVDTAVLVNDDVVYNELAVTATRWTSIGIRNINGAIYDLKSRHEPEDTLKIDARARVFDGQISRFLYREAYGDSLSTFTVKTAFAALDLTRLSQISIPAAAISITNGYVDTAWASWQGNRYAAYGTMNFYFNKFRIKVLNKKDSLRRGVVPEMETWAARLLLPSANRKTSEIFFERDREKFIFNYWVKTQTSGILSALIREKDRTYRKRYEQVASQYSLPHK